MGRWMVSRAVAPCTVVLALFACAHSGATGSATSSAEPSAMPSQSAGQPAVNPDARALVSLQNRIKEYLKLHNKLEATLPTLPKDASPQQIDTHQRALGKLVQDARRNAKPHDLFTPESRRVILKLMKQVFGGPDGRQLRDSIMDENPGNLRITVNERYPDVVPLSTVPPQVLAGLPKLPDELEFRFIGRHLILMDVHAHIIVDFIENAIPA
jgi:hypothetical protein